MDSQPSNNYASSKIRQHYSVEETGEPQHNFKAVGRGCFIPIGLQSAEMDTGRVTQVLLHV